MYTRLKILFTLLNLTCKTKNTVDFCKKIVLKRSANMLYFAVLALRYSSSICTTKHRGLRYFYSNQHYFAVLLKTTIHEYLLASISHLLFFRLFGFSSKERKQVKQPSTFFCLSATVHSKLLLKTTASRHQFIHSCKSEFTAKSELYDKMIKPIYYPTILL